MYVCLFYKNSRDWYLTIDDLRLTNDPPDTVDIGRLRYLYCAQSAHSVLWTGFCGHPAEKMKTSHHSFNFLHRILRIRNLLHRSRSFGT